MYDQCRVAIEYLHNDRASQASHDLRKSLAVGSFLGLAFTRARAGQETRRVQRVEETERERLDRELAARTAASAAQLAQIEEQQKKIEAQVRTHLHCHGSL